MAADADGSARRARRPARSANVSTGLPVLDHLLGELAARGGFDLALEIEPGDAEDEVAARGPRAREAVARPLRATGAGTARRSMPADEALALVVARGVGTAARRARTPTSPAPAGSATDLAARFLEGSRRRRADLHVRLMEGEDTEHVLAAIFKALGVALARGAAPRRLTESRRRVEKHVVRTEPLRRRSRAPRTSRRSASATSSSSPASSG